MTSRVPATLFRFLADLGATCYAWVVLHSGPLFLILPDLPRKPPTPEREENPDRDRF